MSTSLRRTVQLVVLRLSGEFPSFKAQSPTKFVAALGNRERIEVTRRDGLVQALLDNGTVVGDDLVVTVIHRGNEQLVRKVKNIVHQVMGENFGAFTFTVTRANDKLGDLYVYQYVFEYHGWKLDHGCTSQPCCDIMTPSTTAELSHERA